MPSRKTGLRGRNFAARFATADQSVAGIPGYGAIDVARLLDERIDGDGAAVAAETASKLLGFLRARDTVAILAKSGEQLLRELVPGAIGPGPSGLEQVHVEILQAFVVAAGRGRPVPASPRSMVRLCSLARRNLDAYLTATKPDTDADHDAVLARCIRMRTVFYRNVFSSDDAAEIVPALFLRMDTVSERRLGYRMSDFAKALFEIFHEIGLRFHQRVDREEVLREGVATLPIIDAMLQDSDWAQRMWRRAISCPLMKNGRDRAEFQLAEMLWAPIFTFRRDQLVSRFGELICHALFSRALEFGSISDTELSRIYLANPIWERPFIALDADTLFLPLPVLIVGFPFAIIEGLLGSDQQLQKAYSSARTSYLEDEVERIVRHSLPSARIYAGVKWIDPDSNVQYEHDLLAVLGMQVLVFEAKSGKLAAAARRGGLKSLKTNFEELFVEPGRQATRLEALLASKRDYVKLIDRNNDVVQFENAGPSVVHKFGICIEQFASVTNSRRPFQEMGLLESDQQWAPILTLGELRMISARLDTEISFLHYLTRRAAADDVLDFVADEQDLLSMYLTNGFAVDPRALEGRQVMFLQADAAVRGRPSPREDRREFATPGITLPGMWLLIAKEIYETGRRHRFDILISILNQHLATLEGISRSVRRWRSGGGRGAGNTLSTRTVAGDRIFVVAVHMAKEPPRNERSWVDMSRAIANDLAEKLGATDCVVILKLRRSKIPTFDGISFFRFPRAE